ncbi:hypothetical protein [Rhodovulum euryhalinum]|uniref:Uncharacterized protein n=1 Tax=Rhodovulum euryhalinum TaxID=35805 RepID=A0A4R2KJS0_9RHOB|nr:hypothetical protein [Rhodovulum euryhalinum]TCO70258.1 hypothetical protein EV655_11022 [Rhodovulum euryhalinum]
MRKTHLATFCNIESEYGPRAERVTVRQTDGFGNTERKVSVRLSRARFDELYDEIAAEFNDGTAPEFNANAAERLLLRCGALDALENR